jgi:hypothetical protein
VAEAIEASGFVRMQGALSVAGRNPNNRGLDDSSRTWNALRPFGQLEIFAAPAENARFYAKLRVLAEGAADLDGRLEGFDAFPAPAGADARGLRLAGDRIEAEAWELYADLRLPPLSLRVGRQQIVWGETLGRRLLDVVNPLDLSQHLFLEPFVEEFDNLRLPQWLARLSAPLPNPWLPDFAFEALVGPGDGTATRLPAPGSPYNLVPAWVTLRDEPSTGRPSFGARILLEPLGTAVSVAYLTKPSDDAIGLFRGAVPDPRLGLPVNPLPGSPAVKLRFLNEGRHPRMHFVGASASRYVESLGAVGRLEATWAPDQPYQRAPRPPQRFPVAVARRSTWRYALSLDRPTTLLPGQDPTTILGVTFFQTIVAGPTRGIRASGAAVDSAASQVTFTVSQPFRRKTLFIDLLWSYDPDGAYWLQPGLRWIRGDRWRFDLYANLLGGSERRPGRLGALGFADEVVARGTFGF